VAVIGHEGREKYRATPGSVNQTADKSRTDPYF